MADDAQPLAITVVAPVRASPAIVAVVEGSYQLPSLAGISLRFAWLADAGPAIASESDVAAHAPQTVAACRAAAEAGAEAIVVACFADPGVHAAREQVAVPVVGEGEAGLHLASLLCERFTVLATRTARVGPTLRSVRRAGLAAKLASVRPMELPITEADADAAERVADVAARAVREDGADGIVLSCLGADPQLAARVRSLLADRAGRAIEVVDPAQAALGLAFTLAVARRRATRYQ